MDLPIDIDLDAPPHHLRRLAVWYRRLAQEAGRPELAERHLEIAQVLERVAEHAEEQRRAQSSR